VPNVDRINVQPADATKGTALVELQQRFGVTRQETVAVGDEENDLALFVQAGLAIAVANATAPAKAAAHRVLSQPDGDGVLALIEEILAGSPSAEGPTKA
jgi:hypothetical protein